MPRLIPPMHNLASTLAMLIPPVPCPASSYQPLTLSFPRSTPQPLVMHLACVIFKLTLNEALTAATLHAAHALRKADTHGSLQPGKMADMLVLDAPR